MNTIVTNLCMVKVWPPKNCLPSFWQFIWLVVSCWFNIFRWKEQCWQFLIDLWLKKGTLFSSILAGQWEYCKTCVKRPHKNRQNKHLGSLMKVKSNLSNTWSWNQFSVFLREAILHRFYCTPEPRLLLGLPLFYTYHCKVWCHCVTYNVY